MEWLLLHKTKKWLTRLVSHQKVNLTKDTGNHILVSLIALKKQSTTRENKLNGIEVLDINSFRNIHNEE